MKKKVIQILSIALCMVLLSEALSRQMQQRNHRIQVHIRQYLMQNIIIIPTRIFRRRLDMMHRSCSIILYLPAFMREDQAALNFNVAIYRANYPDLQAAFGNDLASYCAHYAANGAAEGRNATTLISAGEGAQAAIVRGSCTTKFDPRASRATNIAVAASRINGVVIQPGEEFSFNKTILPRTAANGYVEAPIYVSGKHSTRNRRRYLSGIFYHVFCNVKRRNPGD